MTRPNSNYNRLAKLEWLYTQTRQLAQHVDDWAEGFPATTSSGPQGKGGHSDRVATEATGGMLDHTEDPITRQTITTTIPEREGHNLATQAQQVLDDIAAINTLIEHATRTARRVQPMGDQAAQLRTRPESTTPGAGWCNVDACDAYCTGAKNDCIVTGMCPTHARAWRRLRQQDPDASLTVFRTTTPVQRTDTDNEPAGIHHNPDVAC